jgi:sugar phosphate isomerase/epimerase
MPQLGAFARMWKRDSAAQIAEVMAAEGLAAAQWNFSAVGQLTVSGERTGAEYAAVRAAMAASGLSVWGLSCTYNLLDADLSRRADLHKAAVQMISMAPVIGAMAVTICTGSRAPDGWTFHPDNQSARAWSEMRAGLDLLLAAAGQAGVVIGVEPEGGSVVSDATAGARLLDEVGTDAPLGFILDAWNLLAGQPRRREDEVLGEAFAVLGSRTVCLHAKDPLSRKFSSPRVDYEHVAELHVAHAPRAPVVMQDVAEDDVGRTVALLQAAWVAVGSSATEPRP